MTDIGDKRPAKQQKTQGRLLLEELNQVEDDDVSSTTSSSSSGDLLPIQLPQRLPGDLMVSDQDEIPTAEEESDDGEDEAESTSSSESEEPDEDQSLGEEASGELAQGLHFKKPRIPRFTRPPTSELKSRLQEFLPQLQQANSELENAGDVLEKRMDEVSDDAEHYIEMNLGLGVLTEERDGAGQVKMMRVREEDDDVLDESQIEVAADLTEEKPLTRLTGDQTRKVTKRKIEELG